MGIAIEDLLHLGENEFSDLFGWNSIVYTFQKGDRPDTQKCVKFHDSFKIFSMCATPLNRKLVNCLFLLVLHAHQMPSYRQAPCPRQRGTATRAATRDGRSQGAKATWRDAGGRGLLRGWSSGSVGGTFPPGFVAYGSTASLYEHAGCMLPPEKQLVAAQMAPDNYSRPRTH